VSDLISIVADESIGVVGSAIEHCDSGADTVHLEFLLLPLSAGGKEVRRLFGAIVPSDPAGYPRRHRWGDLVLGANRFVGEIPSIRSVPL
jgi:hypothetical protein